MPTYQAELGIKAPMTAWPLKDANVGWLAAFQGAHGPKWGVNGRIMQWQDLRIASHEDYGTFATEPKLP